jgi:hypothetical protein
MNFKPIVQFKRIESKLQKQFSILLFKHNLFYQVLPTKYIGYGLYILLFALKTNGLLWHLINYSHRNI